MWSPVAAATERLGAEAERPASRSQGLADESAGELSVLAVRDAVIQRLVLHGTNHAHINQHHGRPRMGANGVS